VVPKNIASLKNLEMLSLSNNRLESLGPWVRKLTRLTYFNLSKNSLNVLIEDLRHLKFLETLLIQENKFEKLPLFFHEFTKLKELGLDWFLFLSPSLEKTVVQKDRDPIFNNLMFFLKKKVEDVTLPEFLSEFSEKKNCQMDPIFKLLNRSFLYKCASNNNLGVLSVILKKTPHLMNELNEEGYSLFAYTLLNKMPFLPDLLLQFNCDLTRGFGAYNSPLNLAISMLNCDLCIQMLKNGQPPNIVDNEGNTPLHLLFDGRFSQMPSHKAKEICHLLMEAGLYPNIENKAKFTALHLAIKTDQLMAIEWALKYNQRKRNKKKEYSMNLFDFDKKFGAFYFTAAHYAVFLGKGTIIELMAQFPEEVDLFERCKTGKSPRQVAYKSISLIKICIKCEKTWLKNKILQNLNQRSNINKIPEGIMVNQMLENKLINFERPKARSEFHKNTIKLNGCFKDKIEVDEMDESPLKVGSRSILTVKTIDKAPNDIARINERSFESNELEECLKVQNQILLNIQYKTIELEHLEKIFKNLMGFLNNQDLLYSDKLITFFFIRLFQYKINLWTQKFTSKILPYSIFLINTFFNSPIKPNLFKKRVQILQKYLLTYAGNLIKELNKEKETGNDYGETQNQLLFMEFIRICLDSSQNGCDPSFSYEKLWNKNCSVISKYELYHAHKYLNHLKKAMKSSKTSMLMMKEQNTKTEKEIEKPVVSNDNPPDNPNLKNLYYNGKKVCVAMPKNQLQATDEEMIIETTRRCSLKAYYFPSKQDFSPFQTKEKGGLQKLEFCTHNKNFKT